MNERPEKTRIVASDAYDRARFREIREDSSSIRTIEDKGSVLLPHFPALLEDLFAALYKLNVVFRPDDETSPSVQSHRMLLEGILASDAYRHLHGRTQLDEAKAALGACLLGEGLLESLRSEKVLTRRDLLDQFELQAWESEANDRRDEAERTTELTEEESLDEEQRKRLEELADTSRRSANEAETQLRRKAKTNREDLERTREQASKHAEMRTLEAARGFDDTQNESAQWGEAFGTAGKGSAARSLELGRRLARDPKLRKVARLVGRMQEEALNLRRRLFERASEETFSIETGSEIGRLLPQELVLLSHPLLRLDWRRRFVEGMLLQYRLRGRRGRGPMVVCLDVSSSMAGDKEIWAKAVTLTLMEIARRERRRFRAILFSSGEASTRTFDPVQGQPPEVDLPTALDLAEHFPGGGTDFQSPLDLALETLGESRYRRGDLVFVTDGESRVEPNWREQFLAEKRRLDFALHAILVDVGPSTVQTLGPLSDRMLRVSDLTAESVRDVFGAV